MAKKFFFLLCLLLLSAIFFSCFLFFPKNYFLFTGEESITLLKYTGNAKRVFVPAKINGKKVTALAPSVFAGNSQIEEIIFPKAITQFDIGTVNGCCSLKRLVFKANCLTLTDKNSTLSSADIEKILPRLKRIDITKIKCRQDFAADFPLKGIQMKYSSSRFGLWKQKAFFP